MANLKKSASPPKIISFAARHQPDFGDSRDTGRGCSVCSRIWLAAFRGTRHIGSSTIL